MKKIYTKPYITITEIKSDDVMTVSGFRPSVFSFQKGRNEVTKF